MTRLLALLPVSILIGCAPDPCTVVDNADGTWTLTCPDGTSATLANGSDGEDGADGADGTNGSDGEDGISWLIRTDEEPPGSNCPAGGILITSGPDTNANGELDLSEVQATEYVCNGEDGSTTHGHLTFPSATSTLYNGLSTTTLGYGGSGTVYREGSYVQQTFDAVGFEEISHLTYAFVMYDGTIAGCDDDVRDFAITVNGTEVGTYAFTGGARANLAFSDTLEFAPVAGAGTNGQRYTLRIEALDAVCELKGSYNWYAGGQFIVSP